MQLSSIHSKANANAVSNQGDVRASSLGLGLANGEDKVGLHDGVLHIEGCAVEQLILKENNRVRVSDSCLQQAFAVLRIVGRNDLKSGTMGIPSGKALRMLGSNTLGTAVGSTEHNWDVHFSSGHIECLRSRVDHLINSLHGEVEGHELKDRSQVVEGSSNSKPREAHLSDWGVNDPFVSPFLPEPPGHLVGSVVLGNLLSHDEHLVIPGKLLIQGHVQRISQPRT